MSQGARDLLTRGIAAAKAEEKDEARFYLEWVLRTDANRQQKAQAWLWLGDISDDPVEKRNCLEEVLVNDPGNALARRGLAVLDGRLDPEEIIDPNRPSALIEETSSQPIEARRFVCRRCGGKMAFKPDGKSLRCEYCSSEQTVLDALNTGAVVQEHDFIVALATAKGHTHPVGVRPFSCQGCGASFMLGHSALSLTCSYCGSAQVVELPETRQLIPPEGLIPFSVSEQEARRAFHVWIGNQKWREKIRVASVRGFYLPMWTFDLVGEIHWQCQTYREDSTTFDVGGFPVSISNRSRRLVREEGNYPVLEDDILVPASHKLPADLVIEEARRFDLQDVVPYDEAYLADWPAEVYEISVSDASLVARRETLVRARRFVKTRVNATLGNVKNLQLNSSRVLVESYKLLLLPIWTTRYRYEDKIYHVVVNGQSGEVRAQKPHNWLQKLLGGLLD